MSSGVKGSASRVSIPSGVRKTIENIKEITGQNHTEDEIYAMLKDCSMDPNETAQRLLQLDTFHEVRRKRDKRRENHNKEPAELKWKPGPQSRAARGGRGSYSSRHTTHDTGGGRNSAAVKESAGSHVMDKGITSKGSLVTSQDVRKSATSSIASPVPAISNGPSGVTSKNANETVKALGTKDAHHQIPEFSNSPAPGLGNSLSADPALSSSQNFPLPNTVGAIQREVGNQDDTAKLIDGIPENKSSSVKISTSETGVHNLEVKVPNDVSGAGKSQHLESVPIVSSAGSASTGSRPVLNYNNRSQVIGQQKVGTGKEWKPKSTTAGNGQGASTVASAEVSLTASVGGLPESQKTTPVISNSKEATLELQRKLEESHISDSQHVIIPNHLHVPEVAKLGFCFGSFDASFGLEMNQNDVPASGSLPLAEPSETIDEPVKEAPLSNQSELEIAGDEEMEYTNHPQSPSHRPENFSSNEGEVLSSVPLDYSEPKPEVAPGNNHPSVVHTSSGYNLGFVPQILSGQLTLSEGSESQARDAPRLPGFIVPQSFDPASYYAQFYRPGLESDGRISPFHPGAVNKYNGNGTLVSAQTSQTPQELQGGVPMVLSTASPTPLVTQAAGVMQSSATQQPLPVFRQPAGVHLPHYPPNYIPYGPFFSPFYVPPPSVHQFLGNGAFPPQPQAGSMYPTAPGTAAKYSVSQYKQGSNTGNSAHIGLPGSYGPYGLSVANYASSSATGAVTSTSGEDIGAPQIKENNVYAGGQQNEGSGVWFTTPNRDLSTLTANSFYNIPQGQLAFTPTQPGHGAFAGIFHPAQGVNAANVHPLLQQSQGITNPVDMVGPTAGVYQQPQHAQLNWPSNY